MYLHGKALPSLLRLLGPALPLHSGVPWLGGGLALPAFPPPRRGTGLPGAQPHRCEPVPDVGWRCGIHSPAHAGETAQRETRGGSLALGKKSVR